MKFTQPGSLLMSLIPLFASTGRRPARWATASRPHRLVPGDHRTTRVCGEDPGVGAGAASASASAWLLAASSPAGACSGRTASRLVAAVRRTRSHRLALRWCRPGARPDHFVGLDGSGSAALGTTGPQEALPKAKLRPYSEIMKVALGVSETILPGCRGWAMPAERPA